MDLCDSHRCLEDLKTVIAFTTYSDKTFNFNNYIKNKIKNKKADKKWRSIHRLLYTLPYEDLALYINSPKDYKRVVASWRLKNGIL